MALVRGVWSWVWLDIATVLSFSNTLTACQPNSYLAIFYRLSTEQLIDITSPIHTLGLMPHLFTEGTGMLLSVLYCTAVRTQQAVSPQDAQYSTAQHSTPHAKVSGTTHDHTLHADGLLDQARMC